MTTPLKIIPKTRKKENRALAKETAGKYLPDVRNDKNTTITETSSPQVSAYYLTEKEEK